MGVTYIGYSHNGIGNQYCSIQLFAGLAGYFKNLNIDLVWHEISTKMQDPQRDAHNLMDTSKIDKHLDNQPIRIFDLVDFNYPNVTIHESDLHLKDRSNVNLINAQNHFINVSGKTENIESFAHGRNVIVWDLERENVLTQTLVWYSKFFYDRSADIDSSIRKLTFKKEYVWLAKKIAREIGPFNGMQARMMPDHHQYYKFTDKSFEAGVDKFDNKDLPIIASVDNWNDPLIVNNKHNIKLIDDIILNDYLSDFKELPLQNRITLALLSALVMIESEDFVATPFSTFSTMILQHRHNRVGENWKYFPTKGHRWIDNYDKNNKPYSWSNQAPVVWDRDWEESKLK